MVARRRRECRNPVGDQLLSRHGLRVWPERRLGLPNTNTSDNGVGKIDYRLNSQHSLNGMVFVGNYLGNGEDHPITASYWQNGNPIRTYTVTSNWIWTASSSLLNDFRFGFNNASNTLVPDDANLFANGKDFPLNTGITSTGGFPSV